MATIWISIRMRLGSNFRQVIFYIKNKLLFVSVNSSTKIPGYYLNLDEAKSIHLKSFPINYSSKIYLKLIYSRQLCLITKTVSVFKIRYMFQPNRLSQV